ncbi:glycosyltransferase family 2 protein [Halobellus rufus]|uniref:glycosyltransferase family 2 protein n=1 Tax=Halobellus rufus TaxID=1448860 RepID=UPI0006796AE4|nr:glycosyltransferase family 2 protein [Halobellus rufus]
MVKYSVCVCNYNMADTVEESLRSILNQLDDRFEMVVVDDGSTDGSLSILNRLESEYEKLRVVIGDNSNLAEARNQSFEVAKGDYILESLDTDDVYGDGIQDFVFIFKELDSQIDRQFYLKGNSINIAPRELLLSIPYRSLGWGEDQDFWRRLFANDAIIWLDHKPFYESIGYNYTSVDQVKLMYENQIVDLRAGISFWSLAQYIWDNWSLPAAVLYSLMLVPAYFKSLNQERYDAPSGFERKQDLHNAIDRCSMSLSEIEDYYNITVDRSELSQFGQRVFVNNDFI